jgi:alpha-tubulin suppressor-like RCC1 family protein
VRSDGTVYAWGSNGHGSLGDGTATERNTPVRVRGLTAVVAIAAGGYNGYAARSDGTVYAWGSNAYGQLGEGTTTANHSDNPVQVDGLTGITAVAAGNLTGYALRSQ